MAQVREIKSRIKAVGNIQRITRTMQMIATAKFQAAVRRTTETKPYTRKVAELVGEVAGAGEAADYPLLSGPAEPAGRELMLVLTSNRGLCGGYNGNVLRTANQFMSDREDQNFELEVSGKKGLGYFRFARKEVSRSYTQFEDKPEYDEVEQIAKRYIDRFRAGEFDAVRVAFMQFVSNSKQTPHVLTLLPLERPEEGEQQGEGEEGGAEQGGGEEGRAEVVYEFSPDPATLLRKLLPLTVKSRLFQCFNDAGVSEQIARMVAMKAATDNADQMGRNLKREFNRARQAQITTELNEIISGAAALE